MSTGQCPGAVATATSDPASGGMRQAAGSALASVPLVIDVDVQRDALAAVVEMSALAETLRRLDQDGPDAYALQLMAARIHVLCEALCWVFDGGSSRAAGQLRDALKLPTRDAA